jgi:glycosyltransferase involved in cell wall biosynthesis
LLISVVVPMYNAEPYLAACLDALVSQDFPCGDYEVLLVDNGSTDGSVAIARRHPAVTLLSEATRGAYSARNRGIRQARGEVIAFTDPDCVPDRSWLREIAAALSDPRVELVSGRRRPAIGTGLLASVADYGNAKDAFVLEGDDAELYYGHCNNMAVRRRVFEILGLFAERPRGSDVHFVRRVAGEYSCGPIRYAPAAAVTHLELDSVAVYYKKVCLYGRHRRLNNWAGTRALRLAERMAVFRRTVRAGRYSWARSAALLATLAAGWLAWLLGSASAVVRGSSRGPQSVPSATS